ncbi:MAG: enoyl-CoA hydratase-related protein [Paracoccus sp. (in: a-proteobacteria)]|nr:enoyl-CoA hydratase-related protein [Paracoccus sp. (in: a-proteobacteria)]
MSDTLVTLEFHSETGIAWLMFNRPDVLNAIDIGMAQDFATAVARLSGLGGLRCVVLHGAGRAFMAGGDVAGFAGAAEGQVAAPAAVIEALLSALNPALLTLRGLDAPVLAAVHGVAAGAGFSIALAADLVLAAEDSRFLLAYDRIGAIPDCGGSWFLPRRIGMGRAARLMLLSQELTAPEALDWGLADRLAPAEGFRDATEALAQRLASGPSRAFGAWRRLADSAFQSPLGPHLEAERTAFATLTATHDFREGAVAFVARRKPHFRGD